jgi:TatA/E family protein of Tat protein translocase
MFGISLPELLLIFVLILVVLGPEKLPEVARWVGKGLREVRKASNLMRDALMLDDDEGYRKRQALPRSPSTTQPTLGETPRSQEIPRPDPSLTTAPAPRVMPDSVALDQAGDDFDRAFASHYNAPYSELIEVPLHPGTHEVGAPLSLFEVSLKPPLESQALVYVPFPERREEIAQW